jgi:hypothetical protein
VSDPVLLKLFFLSFGLWTAGMWLAMVITRVACGIPQYLAIVGLRTLMVLMPFPFYLDWILATILMYVLIVKLTNASFYPDAVLMVGVSNLMYVALGTAILSNWVDWKNLSILSLFTSLEVFSKVFINP